MTTLNELKELPQEILTCKSTELYDLLGGPTLIKIPGRRKPAMFLSCLMHGNEYTGLLAFQELFKKYGFKDWPRETWLFFGNLKAAAQGRRHLDDQPDFNRIWMRGEGPEQDMARQVVARVKEEGLFASIDIHNNTGRNPHYSIVTKLKPEYLNLAATFNDVALLFTDWLGTHTEVFSEMCPSVTVEAGLPGKPDGTQHVFEFVDTVLNYEEMPSPKLEDIKLKLLKMVGTIKLPQEASVGINDEPGDFVFSSDLDLVNFTEVEPGYVWGQHNDKYKLNFFDRDDNDIAADYFEYNDGKVTNKKMIIPAMISPDKIIIKSDCLSYALEQVKFA